MISQKLLKDYEIQEVYQYYDICIDSYINGQIAQAKTQIKKFSKEQKLDFIEYLKDLPNEYFNFFIKHLF